MNLYIDIRDPRQYLAAHPALQYTCTTTIIQRDVVLLLLFTGRLRRDGSGTRGCFVPVNRTAR